MFFESNSNSLQKLLIYFILMTQTVQNTINAYQSPFTLNKKIKALEQQHKELQQNLKERVQSLIMQINLPIIIDPLNQSQLNPPLIDSMLQQHTEMHMLTSNKLLQNQIEIQQESQAREIIRNYQKRISDLRNSLVNKQAEIVYEIVQLRRDTIPKRENMQILNNQNLEKHNIQKSLQELKRLKVQVQALEYTINKKAEIKVKESEEISIASNSLNNKAQLQKLDNVPLKKINSGMQKDKLLGRVNGLLQEQLARQAKLEQDLRLSKSEWQKVAKQHQELCRRYKALQLQKVKINQNNYSTEKILEEIQKQEEKDNQIQTLFNLKDLNVLKANPKRFQKIRQNLKEKRKQAKEN